jgi:outer membrane protein assembly factor BamA
VYIDKGYGGQLAFTRTLAPRASASTAYRFEMTRVEASDVYFCVNYGVCDIPTVASLRLHQRLSPLLASASIDRSDVPFSPTKGYIARVDLEHASRATVSDYRFNRLFGEASAYTHFRYPSRDPRSQVLAGNLRIGYVRPLAGKQSGIDLLHPRKRFYAGGSHSVRGYDENQLGPRILTIPPTELAKLGCDISSATTIRACNPNAPAPGSTTGKPGLADKLFTPRPVGGTSLLEASVEFRVPFARKMEWAAFLDGAVVGGSDLQSLSDLPQLVRGTAAITPGVGFRYRSPVGPIRIDLGYNPHADEDLFVVSSALDSLGRQRLVQLANKRKYISGGSQTGILSLFNRMVLHLSIGQAY